MNECSVFRFILCKISCERETETETEKDIGCAKDSHFSSKPFFFFLFLSLQPKRWGHGYFGSPGFTSNK